MNLQKWRRLVHDFSVGQSSSVTEGGFRIPLGMSVPVRWDPITALAGSVDMAR